MTDENRSYPRQGLLGGLSVLRWEGMREQDRANERRVNLYAILWAISLMAAAALVEFLELPPLIDGLLAAIPALFGLLSLKAYLKLLREADEMLRQIQFEAMAAGFGTGLIVGMTCVLIDLPSHWVAPAIVAPMCFSYSARIVMAARAMVREQAN